MKQLKKKKGFTLVELIVVIAIIAILAAIAVPTTMHFVEKANISKEAQQMNISDTLQSIFVNSVTEKIDLSITDDAEKGLKKTLTTLLGTIPADLGVVEINLTKQTGGIKVDYVLYGTKYGDKSDGQIKGTLSGLYQSADIVGNKTINTTAKLVLKLNATYTGAPETSWTIAP